LPLNQLKNRDGCNENEQGIKKTGGQKTWSRGPQNCNEWTQMRFSDHMKRQQETGTKRQKTRVNNYLRNECWVTRDERTKE